MEFFLKFNLRFMKPNQASGILCFLLTISVHLALAQDEYWLSTNSPGGGNFFGDIIIDNEDNIYLAIPSEGLFKSADSGENWGKIADDFGAWGFQSLAKSPSGKMFAGDQAGLYHSVDGGVNWTHYPESVLPNRSIPDILIVDESTIYIAVYLNGIYRSFDNGETWEQVNNGISRYDFNVLAQGPDGTIYLGTKQFTWNSKVYKLENGSNTWIELSGNDMNNDVESMIFTDSGQLLIAGRDKIWAYNETEDLYEPLVDLGVNDRINTLVTKGEDEIYYGGGFVLGPSIYVSADGGESWVPRSSGINETVEVKKFVKNSEGVIFAATIQHGVFADSTVNITTEAKGTLPPGIEIKIYPNPTSDIARFGLSFETPSGFEFTLFDPLGKPILNLKPDTLQGPYHEFQYNLRDLPNGIYLCRILYKGTAYLNRIVKHE